MLSKSLIIFFILTIFLYSNEYSQTIKNKKIYPLGEKIYAKKCSKIILFSTKEALSLEIKKSCQKLKPKYREALYIYLWDKQSNLTHDSFEIKAIDKKEKCPLCGMWVYKYPKWVAQIQTKDAHLSFDGVKDLMKYVFTHEKNDNIIVVRDYYSQKPLDARVSYFVLGSDVYGPMGEELIPFKTYEDAQTFLMDHKAKKILKFSEIKKENLH